MKWKQLSIIVILILSTIGISGCLGPSQGINAKSIIETPENFINISEDRMRFFPHLEEAILNEKTYVDTPVTEFYEVRGFLILHDTEFICYKNNYYEIGLYYTD